VTHADHIVDVDTGIAELWGRLNVPDPLPVIDGLLAASAQAHARMDPGHPQRR
jgi:toxin FitB